MRFYWERVEASRNFANKVWNASRFIMMNIEKVMQDEKSAGILSLATGETPANLTDADKWILSKVNTLAKDVTTNMDSFELGVAVQKVYDFIWEEFCDWYIEMVKPRLWNEEDATRGAAIWTLKTVLINALKLLHPFMPFITEEIYCNLLSDEDMGNDSYSESIMISKWPEYKDEWNFAEEENAIETIKEAVRGIRNTRTSMNVPPSRKAKVYVVTVNEKITQIFTKGNVFFTSLSYASDVTVQKDKAGIDDDAVAVLIPDASIYIPFSDLVDVAAEIERLEAEKKKLEGELARSNAMLGNEKFISKAPAAKIEEEKVKLAKYETMMKQVQERLEHLK